MMKSAFLEEEYLKLAIQTTLHRRRHQWEELLSGQNPQILDELVEEITDRACRFRSITDSAMKSIQDQWSHEV